MVKYFVSLIFILAMALMNSEFFPIYGICTTYISTKFFSIKSFSNYGTCAVVCMYVCTLSIYSHMYTCNIHIHINACTYGYIQRMYPCTHTHTHARVCTQSHARLLDNVYAHRCGAVEAWKSLLCSKSERNGRKKKLLVGTK